MYYKRWSLIQLSKLLYRHYSQYCFVNRHLNNAWYNKLYSLIGQPYLAMVAGNGFNYENPERKPTWNWRKFGWDPTQMRCVRVKVGRKVCKFPWLVSEVMDFITMLNPVYYLLLSACENTLFDVDKIYYIYRYRDQSNQCPCFLPGTGFDISK